MDNEELAERVEALDGPCRKVDVAIYDLITGGIRKVENLQWCKPSWYAERIPMEFTASLDAAMTLLEVPDFDLITLEPGKKYRALINGHLGHAATPALALCAAALRAKSEDQ